MSNVEQETERRFLVWNIPNINYDEIIKIEQCYRQDIPERIRQSEHFLAPRKPYFDFWLSDKSKTSFERTLKETVPGKEGVRETNNKLNNAKYIELRSIFPNVLRKIRHVKKCKQNPGLKWELDDFSCHNTENCSLIIVEIEVPSMAYDLKIPGWLKPAILTEITGQDEFANFNIAKLGQK